MLQRSCLRIWRSAVATAAIGPMLNCARSYATPGKVKINVKYKDGTKSFEAPENINLMEALRDIASLPVEGTCDGCMECGTCHVYLGDETYNKVEKATDMEEDVLDKTLNVQDNSRLACQIYLTDSIPEMDVTIPDRVNNLME